MHARTLQPGLSLANRRSFLGRAAVAATGVMASASPSGRALGDLATDQRGKPLLRTRGVVLGVSDLRTLDWPTRAKAAGLTTIGTHISPEQVKRFITSEQGQDFIESCRRLGLEVEHELHAMNDLLPRSLFAKDPAMFRMNEKGERVSDWNLCVHSHRAVEIVCENAVRYAKVLRPTTGRYFYWIDDNRPMCYCPKCRALSAGDQALLLENEVLAALRRFDRRATLAHLAYMNTLQPPTQVKPAPGVFLEFAPIVRSWESPLRRRETVGRLREYSMSHGKTLDLLDANLEVFDARDAQVLEYWLDVSMFSRWKRPAVKLPWQPEVFADDVRTYTRRGISHITSFAVMIDADYVRRFGEPPLEEYGRVLRDVTG